MAAFRKPIPDPTVDGPTPPGLGWTNWRATSYVVSEPVGAGTWYPVNDEPTDKASYRFTITGRQALCRGRQRRAALRHRPRRKRRYVWEQVQPMASYLAIADVDQYKLEQRQSASGVPIRSFMSKATPAETIAALRQDTGDDGFHREGGRPLSVRRLRRGDGGRSGAQLRPGDPGNIDIP